MMRKAFILAALVLMFLLSTTSAFAMVDAEKPPEGMVGNTSVDEGTSVEEPTGTPEEEVRIFNVVEGEGVDPSTATTDLPEVIEMRSNGEPQENLMDSDPVTTDIPTNELGVIAESQVLAADADDIAANSNKQVTVYYIAGAGLLAVIVFIAALRRRSVRQGA